MTDEQIAHNIGISCGRFYEWEKKYNEFREAVKRGKAPVDIEVENALLKRATGYTVKVQKPVKVKTKKQLKDKGTIEEEHIEFVEEEVYIPPDTTAQIYWLNNRRPDKWKNRKAADTEQPNVTLDKAKEILGGVRSAID